MDCLRFLDDRSAGRLLDRALQTGWIIRPEMVRRARALTGRRGAPRLVRLIRQASGGAHSEAERRAVALLRRSGITGWVANEPIPGTGAVGDLVFEGAGLIVEIDGRAHHSGAVEFQRDRTRQNRLVEARLDGVALHVAGPDRTAGPRRGHRRAHASPTWRSRFRTPIVQGGVKLLAQRGSC